MKKILVTILIAAPAFSFAQLADSATRKLPMQGALNFRDAGGYKTKNGNYVITNKIFRSADISKLTDADMQLMTDKKIYTVIDFRGIKESAAAPDRLLPHTDYLLCNAGSDSLPDMAAIAALIKQGGFLKKMYGAESLAYYGPRYRPVFQKLLALPDTAAILYHCTAGRDRTGMATALILYALGVPQQTIEADFTASNVYLIPMHSRMFSQMSAVMDIPMERVKKEIELTPELIQVFFNAINQQYGSTEAFMEKELGVGKKEVELLRKKYTVAR